MCLMVYLGTRVAVPGSEAVALCRIGLDPEPCARPVGLSGKLHVARVAHRLAEGWNCSCVFLGGPVPWEDSGSSDDPDAEARQAAFADLRDIERVALRLDPEACLLSCWSGGEDEPPEIERVLSPDDLRADRNLFTDIPEGGGGHDHSVLIRLRARDGG
jgi:hypothetical protein